jgi:hypothetical protein
MGNVFEGAEMDTLVVPELAVAHVTVVLDDFPDVFWGEVLFQGQILALFLLH